MKKENEQFEQEQQMWQYMDSSTKDLCERTLSELKKITEDNDLTLLSVIDKETVEKVCREENVMLLDSFSNTINTPYSLAKYLRIMSDQEKMITKINDDFKSLLDDNDFYWFIPCDFSNTAIISKKQKTNDESKPQSLDVKYRYDVDNDKIQYSLIGKWGWDITKEQLKALLNNKPILSSAPKIQESNTFNDKNKIKLDLGDIEITIDRK